MGKIKKGVSILGLKPEIILGFVIIKSAFNRHGYVCRLTSGVDGKHMNHSHHKKGLAIDIGIRGVPRDELEKIINECYECLGDEFQLIVEGNHIHCEFDPK